MTLKNRLQQLEKRRNEQPYNTPQIVEIWGTREDGITYLIETWKQLMEADASGHLNNYPQWQKFIEDGTQ